MPKNAVAVKSVAKRMSAPERQKALIDLLLREYGATSAEMQDATGEPKRRSHYSLSKLADRFGYIYSSDGPFEDTYPLLSHIFRVDPEAEQVVPGAKKTVAKSKPAAKKVAAKPVAKKSAAPAAKQEQPAAKPTGKVVPFVRPAKKSAAK